ncbi:UNVERIFIED_CONTAM: amidohydrolase, partial [Salmonella enterica subsp. enterica serovar Weltevreden]
RCDVEATQKALKQAYWCLCPHANRYIENSLPDVSLLSSMACTLTLGTDSLASNSELSIFREILALQAHFPQIALETLL